jgi:hypothetical protein
VPLFGPRSLPPTSYGYRPPPDATAHGWICANPECRCSRHETVRRWPRPCDVCGTAADPQLDPPWEHEAAGAELRWRLAQDPDGGGGFYQDQWEVWQFKDAIVRGDAAAISRARARARTYTANKLATSTWWQPDGVFFYLVWAALEAGDAGGAAGDVVYWLSVSSSADAEDNNSVRTNCRQVIDMAARVLAAPGAASTAQATEIRQGCVKLAEGCYPVLNREQQTAVMQMARS